ncbi:MAG: DUF6665 family protein [Xanthobacteraceae bacterium]
MSGERNRLIDAAKNPSAALDYEIAQEIAATLGRLGRKLESALGELTAFDTAAASRGERNPAERQSLLRNARTALWNFVVQREACGLRDARQVIIDYRVPVDVQHAVAVPPLVRRGTRL